MPVDQRRINGPEVSLPYDIYVDTSSKHVEAKEPFKKRQDLRESQDIRKLFIKLGVVSHAKGSAYVEAGQTKVICSAFDPREIPNKSNYRHHGTLYCEFRYATFSSEKRRIHQQDADEKEYSLVMKRALEPAVCRNEFPNFQVDVYALVLDNGGSALSTAIMAASLALANAGVPMFGIVTAVTAGIYDDMILLDPTDKEESMCMSVQKRDKEINHGIIVQSIVSQPDQVSEFLMLGNLNSNCLTSIVDTLHTVARDLFPVLQQALIKTVRKSIKRKCDEDMATELE